MLRRAAEELALFADEYEIGVEAAPTMLDVWWLFGFEGASGTVWSLTRKEELDLSDERKRRRALWQDRFQAHLKMLVNRADLSTFICRAIPAGKERDCCRESPILFLERLDSRRQKIHTRGALTFWDVFPKPPKNTLAEEIMTPHYSDYYQAKTSPAYPNGATPHDAGQPNPIPFLAVPAGSTFDFHVLCEPYYLPDLLRSTWKPLLKQILTHVFEWLGFGAKTAAGYGVMESDTLREAVPIQTGKPAGEALRQAMSPEERAIEDLRTIYESDKKAAHKEPNGDLASRRVGLLREAKTWEPVEMRRKAADLIEETARWLPWPRQKRDERLKELEVLRRELAPPGV